jgi:hypothetical protein
MNAESWSVVEISDQPSQAVGGGHASSRSTARLDVTRDVDSGLLHAL